MNRILYNVIEPLFGATIHYVLILQVIEFRYSRVFSIWTGKSPVCLTVVGVLEILISSNILSSLDGHMD